MLTLNEYISITSISDAVILKKKIEDHFLFTYTLLDDSIGISAFNDEITANISI